MYEHYVSIRGCLKCKIAVPIEGTCCPKCGGTFYDETIGELIYRKYWIFTKIVWYKPSTWCGGYWKHVYEDNP